MSGQGIGDSKSAFLFMTAFAKANTQGVKASSAIGVTPQVAAGGEHTVALKSDGTVWAWGYNAYGQLGNGNTTDSSIPVQVAGIDDVSAIAVGGFHTVALKSDGTVWAWGYNEYGQLGDGGAANSSTPVQVIGISDVSAISAGGAHTIALKNDGMVWAWGFNCFGQLGDGTELYDSAHLYSPQPVQVVGICDVSSVACGNNHTVALKSNGTVWTWGWGGYGQLGNGGAMDSSTPAWVSDISGVSAIGLEMSYHSTALKIDGTVWGWGYNSHGQLGDGTTTNSWVPVQVAGFNLYESASHSLSFPAPKSDSGFGAGISAYETVSCDSSRSNSNYANETEDTLTTSAHSGSLFSLWPGRDFSKDNHCYWAENSGKYVSMKPNTNGVGKAPTVNTGLANPSSTSATLHGIVNPNGAATTVYFQYGTTTSYGFMVTCRSQLTGLSAQAVSQSIKGLKANTTYHYRVKASNGYGTTYGYDGIFTTSSDNGGKYTLTVTNSDGGATAGSGGSINCTSRDGNAMRFVDGLSVSSSGFAGRIFDSGWGAPPANGKNNGSTSPDNI